MAKTLKEYFVENGESFDHVSEKHSIGKSYLNRVVNGKVGCSLSHFLMIAHWVKMPKNEAIDEWTNRMCGRIKQTAKENMDK